MWWDKFFSDSIKWLSYYVRINFFYWPIFFLQTSVFINSISLSFELFDLIQFWIFSYLPTCFWVILFRILGMLVQLNKAAFPLHKTLISLVKSWLWDECLLPCKRLSLHREKHDIYMLNYMFACFCHYYFL